MGENLIEKGSSARVTETFVADLARNAGEFSPSTAGRDKAGDILSLHPLDTLRLLRNLNCQPLKRV